MTNLNNLYHKIPRNNVLRISLLLLLVAQSLNAGEITYTFNGTISVLNTTSKPDPWNLGYGTEGHAFSLSITLDDKEYPFATDAFGDFILVQNTSGFINGTVTIDGVTSPITDVNVSIYDDWQTSEDYFRVIASTTFNGQSNSVGLRITLNKDTFSFTGDTTALPGLDADADDFIKYISAYGLTGYRYYTSAVVSDGNSPPIADASADQMVGCDGADGTFVTLDASGSSDPDGDALTYEWSVPTGVILDDPTSSTPTGLFPIGVTTATLTVIDGNGGLDCDDVVITVVDETPPEVACTTDLAALWPPNHNMIPIMVSVAATDHCTAPENLVLGLVTIQSNEPDDGGGLGDGETVGDVDGEDGYTAPVDVTDLLVFNPQTNCFEGLVFLRAERDDAGFGRTYSINATVLDTFDNLAETSCVVIVPHDRRKK